MIIKENDLGLIRSKYHDKKIVCCLGVFDLTHAGHILFFEDCKKHGDILVVGIGKDALVRKYKGDLRPILNENVRLKIVDSLKPVDYVYLIDKEIYDQKNFHTETLGPLVGKLKPEFYAVNSDVLDIEKRKEICEKNEVNFILLNRVCPSEFDNISTTRIIEKIKTLD